jgi:hypothetical protein
MRFDPFVPLEVCPLGSGPRTALVVRDDLVADADGILWIETGFEEVLG